jgi:CheY-like chemotaxis protein
MGLLSSLGSLFVNDDAATADAAEQQEQERKQRGVLVIDDDPAYLDVTGALLREAGYNVLKSSSGPKGLNVLRYAPDDLKVVLLDFDMPQFNGVETLQFIRRLSPTAKVIGITGVDLKFLPPEFRDGVDELLHKPLDPQTFLNHLNVYFAPAEPALAGK